MDFYYAFHPGQLDRAAQLRTGDDARQDVRAKSLVFWRGKLLSDADNRPVLVPLGHTALGDCREAPVFLGLTPVGPSLTNKVEAIQSHQPTKGQWTLKRGHSLSYAALFLFTVLLYARPGEFYPSPFTASPTS